MAAPIVVSAVPVPMQQPAQQPMMVTVPDGVVPGGQFAVMTPSGMQMMVTCPNTSKGGDQIQIMAPAAPAAMVTPAAPQSHPAARDRNNNFPSLQDCFLTLPQPIRRCGRGSGAPANPDALSHHFHTGSPHEVRSFLAPCYGGIMSEADFDSATMAAMIDGNDPFAAYLSGSPQLALDLDIEGRVKDAVSNLQKTCAMYAAMVAVMPPCICCLACRAAECNGAPPLASTGCGESPATDRLRASAAAHKLTLCGDCIVYERAAHTADIIKNYVAFDQYGHRYPASAVKNAANVPAMKLSIPISRAEVSIVPRKMVVRMPLGVEESYIACCDYTPSGDVVAVSVGDGLKLVVACIEVGKGSNAPAFVDACKRAREGAPAERPELTQAYNGWLLQRMRQNGTMTGGAPQPPEMSRSWPKSTGGHATGFIKSVGPLPAELGITKNSWQANRVAALGGIEIQKSAGQLFSPNNSQFVDQLNAGDNVLAINGVSRNGGPANHEWLDQVAEAGRQQPHAARYMETFSTMPYFQPSHLVTISVNSINELALEGSTSKPPKIMQPNPAAGLFDGDVVVQVACGGITIDALDKSAGDLQAAVAAYPGPVMVTLLQPSRVASTSHTISWPMNPQGL